jgi:leader peptidase (prepilin peptidase) / N-methyltransferase
MWVMYILVGLFGLVFGSFLNVCIARLPRNESIVTPRSHCPRCNHPIRWYDNVPLLSYVILGGKCRNCRARISLLYPLVEALTALVLIGEFVFYGFTPEFVKFAVLGMLLIILIFTDILERRIPSPVTQLGITLGIIISFVIPVDGRPLTSLLIRWGVDLPGWAASLTGVAAGAVAGGGLFYAVGEAFYYFGGRKKEYLGFGDVMLMLMVGTFLGFPLTLLTVLLGSLLGTLVALPLELAGGNYRRYQWPYGTFLGIAGIVVSLLGNRMMHAYLHWAGLI